MSIYGFCYVVALMCNFFNLMNRKDGFKSIEEAVGMDHSRKDR